MRREGANKIHFQSNARSLRPTPTPIRAKAARLGGPGRALMTARSRLTDVGMTTLIFCGVAFLLLVQTAEAQDESFHRAQQDREISYWLLEPSTHQFLISHDFTVTRVGQKSVHSFVRKGSVVSPDAKMTDLDTGKPLKTSTVAGKDVNTLGYYPELVEPDSVAVQGDLEHAVGEGQSTRVRVQETYTDPVGYVLKDGELTWTRTLGRPLNYATLPAGWMLTQVNTPAVITLDEEGRIKLRFTNIRNGDLAIVIKAKKRPDAQGLKPHQIMSSLRPD